MNNSNKINLLSSVEQFQKQLFSAPKGSLCASAITEIADLEKNEIIIHHLTKARVLKRVIAAGMPIFPSSIQQITSERRSLTKSMQMMRLAMRAAEGM